MKKNKSLSVKDHYYKIIPLALILLIVPCIVYLKAITLKGTSLDLSSGDTSYDFFSYYKSVWLIVFTILSVVFCTFYMQTNKIKFKLQTIFIPLIVFYVCTFLSSSFSKYKDVAFGGFTDRIEGFFVITCYVLICLMAAIFVTYEKDVKILFVAIIACGSVLGILGISQFWGFDILQSDFGRHLILPKENYDSSLSFNFPKQYIYSTLFNPNYVGSFFAMLLPLSIALAILSKKISYKIITCVFSCISFINLIGSLSTAGYIAGTFSVILLIVLLNKNFFKAWRTVLVLLVSFTVLLFLMNNVSNGTILPALKLTSSATAQLQATPIQPNQETTSVQSETVEVKPLQLQASQSQKLVGQTLHLQVSQSKFKAQTLELQHSQTQPKPVQLQTSSTQQDANSLQVATKNITDFSIDKNLLKIYMGDIVANVSYNANNNTCTFTDALGKNINAISDTADATKIVFGDPRYDSLSLKFTTNNIITISAPNISFHVYISPEDKVFKFVNNKGVPTDIASAESIGFKGNEKWGSSRGYIWSRTFPLIKDTIFIGHGPDTFAFYFPQNEFDAKLKYCNTPYILVDKPHNMYLQMAINTGVISLVAFIVFVLWFIINTIRLYIKPKSINSYYIAGVSCVTAIVGYLVAGLANDSVIGVSTVFWILLGLGIASNRLYSKSILVPATTNVQTNKKNKK